MDHDPGMASAARTFAAALIDAAVPADRVRNRRGSLTGSG
jgi:hypothetical protein